MTESHWRDSATIVWLRLKHQIAIGKRDKGHLVGIITSKVKSSGYDWRDLHGQGGDPIAYLGASADESERVIAVRSRCRMRS